jgi:hypothetical protein
MDAGLFVSKLSFVEQSIWMNKGDGMTVCNWLNTQVRWRA